MAQVGPEVGGFQEGAGEEVFVAGSGVIQQRPIPQVVLGLLAQRAGHVLVPGTQGEAVVEALQDAQPALDAVLGGVDLVGQGGVAGELSGAVPDQPGQGFDLGHFLDAGQVAQLLAEELLVAQASPSVGETVVLAGEGFGESPVA